MQVDNRHGIYDMDGDTLKSTRLFLFIEGQRWISLNGGDFGIKQITIPVGSVIRIPESGRLLSRSSPGDMADGVFYLNLYEKDVAIATKFIPDARAGRPSIEVKSHGIVDRALQMSVTVSNAFYRPTLEIHRSPDGNDLIHKFHRCLITNISQVPPFIAEGEQVEVEMAFYGYDGILLPKDDGECDV